MKKDIVLTIRIPTEDLKALDDLAQQKGVSRATLARTILANCRRLYNYLEADVTRKRVDEIQLAEDIARRIQDKLIEEVTLDMADAMARVMFNAMAQVAERMTASKGGNRSAK